MIRQAVLCAMLVVVTVLGARAARGQERTELLQPQAFLPATEGEMGKLFPASRTVRTAVFADRMVYRADDVTGQFLVCFLGHVKPEEAPERIIDLELRSEDGKQSLAKKTLSPVETPKVPVLVRTIDLKPGRYVFHAKLTDKAGAVLQEASAAFERSAKADPRPAFPADGLVVRVHEQPLVPDAVVPISTGVPMPKMTLNDVNELVLLENGKPVPAQFGVRATWSPKGPVKWVGLDFQARYDGGKPREYRLVHRPGNEPAKPAKPLRVDEQPEQVVVDTGAIRFSLNRKAFAGIDQAWLDRNGDGQYAADEQVINGAGGSMLVDQKGTRFDTAAKSDSEVIVEESGPMRATVLARGWYHNTAGEPLCQYVIRVNAYAGQPFVTVSHRMINTIADRWIDTRIADLGFELIPAAPVSAVRFGLDGKAAPAELGNAASVSLHQDRSDHARLLTDGTPTGEGKRGDGWITADTERGAVTVFVRDFFQTFPKELEFERRGEGKQSVLTAHFWPEHGHDAFTDEYELSRQNIHKVRWAHEGKLLNMLIPDKYHSTLAEIEKTEPWAGADAQLAIVDAKNNLTKMQVSSGQGSVIGDEMVIWLHDEPSPKSEALVQNGGLFQQPPHALSDPVWNCATGVLGPIAPRSPEKFGPAEHLLDTAYEFYQRAIIDGGENYGMWIYGGVHSSWDPKKDAPQLKRVWQMSHYQNVFQAHLLYFRSGLPEHARWARVHAEQHFDVGVNSYTVYPPGVHSYSHFGDIGGSIYHCKGFMPWAGNSSVTGHWIDIACYYTRYHLTGDRRGLDLGAKWMRNLTRMRGSNDINLPKGRDGWLNDDIVAKVNEYENANPQVKKADYPQWVKDELAKPRPYNPREVFVPLGEFVQYYQATWDPQALIFIEQYAQYLNTPFHDSSAPSLASFGKHWQDWYYELTRDPRVVERVREYMERERKRHAHPNDPSFAAFLYHATGDTQWIKPLVPGVHDATTNIYENPGDRYHEYSLAESNPASMLLGRLPLFLHAIDAAGLTLAHADTDSTATPTRGGRVDEADKWLIPTRGWSNAGFTLLGYSPEPARLAVSIDGPHGYGGFRGLFRMHAGWPKLWATPPKIDRKVLTAEDEASIVTFSAPNAFNDPPRRRNFGEVRAPEAPAFPIIEIADNDPKQPFHRLEVGGDPIYLPALLNAETKAPISQAVVIPRTMFWNNELKPVPFRVQGSVRAYMRPLYDGKVVKLAIEAVDQRYSMPTTVRIHDANGQEIVHTSVLPAGQRKRVDVALDPAQHPLPWRFTAIASGDNRFTFEGAEELLFAPTPQALETIVPLLRKQEQSDPTAAR